MTAEAILPQVMAVVRQRLPDRALLLAGAGDAPWEPLEAVLAHLACCVITGAQTVPPRDVTVSPVALPYPPHVFDLALAWHVGKHDRRLSAWLAEIRRVLAPAGLIVVVEVVVPGSRLRGKVARTQRAAGDYVDALARLQDRAGGRHYALDDWHSVFAEAGCTIAAVEVVDVHVDASTWINNPQNSTADRQRIRAMILQAPEAASVYLQPSISGDALSFRLKMGVFSAVVTTSETAAGADHRV